MIHLHAFDTPNGRKITVALEEMQLPYDVTIVDIGKGEQFSEDFLRISPNNKIPAIVDDEGPEGPLSVFESGAILVYLGQKSGKFWPASVVQQAQVMQWLMFQVGGFGPMPGQVHHFLGLANEQDRRYGLERFQAETRRLYGVMDRHLQKQQWFANDVSIADFAILGWVWRHGKHQVDLADFPAVGRWYQELMARPGVRRGFEIELRRNAG
ncbi:MAG TPA: glutathione S-transferase N-terminal domain-containing protein [Ramlibacter sp.]|jgi:GST-like protein|nr:glutathione S-transferase N-terminal domain-containing protein [Ramlibacter sp.]